MFPNFSMHKQTAMKIFSTEEIFAFSHPKAKTALTKFKQLLLDIG
ncbi:hypothetical protein MICA_2453 [Micavibrio aeruginosavorus ARL-13]|uniref:Uncharacterized protein n=2 Tax=Micavibrio aeruginosavorus TaxID=349221 RepID=G2KNV9_MICAA|nr:hypothetical protein MICA_2453 [Micavibrio aeruginosavorus ARL-13]